MNYLYYFCLLLVTSQKYVEEDSVIILKNKNFGKALQEYPYLLVEFYAPWCGHCTKLAPEYSSAASQLKDYNIILAKVDATDDKVLAAKYQVSGFPTLLFFRGGLKMDYSGQRNAQGIVKWVLEHAQPFYNIIEYQSDLSNILAANNYTVIYFEKQNEQTDKKQEQTIADLSQIFKKVKFILVRQPQLRDQYNKLGDNYIMLLKEGEEFVYTGNPRLFEGVKDFIQLYILPLVCTFDEYLKNKAINLPGLVLWENLETSNYRLNFSQLAHDFSTKIKFIDIQEQNLEDEKKFISQMKVSGLENGAIYIIDTQNNLRYKMNGTVDNYHVSEFINKFLDGALQPMKSLTKQDLSGTVLEITSEDFDNIVVNSLEDVLVEFYAPWCGHCKKLEPIYQELALRLRNNKNIIIAKIDATQNKIANLEVQGYPSIKFFKKGEQPQILDCSEDRSLSGFISFLKKHQSHPWIEQEDL